jgi:STE24 endopeptidase
MRLTLIVAIGLLVLGLAGGIVAGQQPAAQRAADLTEPVDASWYEALPADPVAATNAYLARIPPEMRAHGEAYSDTRYWILPIRIVFQLGALWLFLASGASRTLASGFDSWRVPQWLRDTAYALVMMLVMMCVGLPAEVYALYVRLRSFGFSDQPFFDWLIDDLIEYASTAVFYVIGIAVIFAILRRWPRGWVAAATGVFFVLSLTYVVLAPVWVEPLINHVTPLPDSPLKGQVLAMARANAVPADDVFTNDASTQTRVVNAHVSGLFGTGRITLDDNLLSGQQDDEVRYVVGHESGHYVMNHAIQGVIVATIIAGVGFVFIRWLSGAMIRRFGPRWGIASQTSTGAIGIFWFGFVLFAFLSDPFAAAYSRSIEAQADLYGLNASQAPNGMAEFMVHNFDTQRLEPTGLETLLFFDHPSDRSRLETAMAWRAAMLAAPKG